MRKPDENEVRRLVRDAVERALGPAPGAPSAKSAPASVPAAAPVSPRRVAIGSDHGGFALKEILRKAIADDAAPSSAGTGKSPEPEVPAGHVTVG